MVKEKTLAAIGRWGMLLPPALIAAFAGLAKFTDAENWREMFVGWGYPPWMSPVTGVLEIAGGVAMFVPATRFYGAALVTAVMTVAAVTRLVHGEYAEVVLPAFAVLLAVVTAWWARPDWLDRMVSRQDEE